MNLSARPPPSRFGRAEPSSFGSRDNLRKCPSGRLSIKRVSDGLQRHRGVFYHEAMNRTFFHDEIEPNAIFLKTDDVAVDFVWLHLLGGAA